MKHTTKRNITALSITLALFGGLASMPAATAASMASNVNRYVTISADGSVKVVPDAVRMNATVTTIGANSKEAQASVTKSSAAVRAALTAAMIDKKDIATQSITVYPEYNYTQDSGSKLIGYRASQSFAIIIRNAANAGDIVDSVIAAGGDNLQINGVTPFVLDSTKAAEAAREVAVKNAKSKATSYAKLMSVKLGKVTYIVENSAPASYPMQSMLGKAEADSVTVVDLGQQDVTVNITIRWALL
jgi:uncharacterized protein YggE